MKTILAAAVFALAGLGAAHAMPMTPLGATDSSEIIQVAQGCGPGYARGAYGRCRPMGGVVVVRPGRGCGPGFAFRGGRCRPF